MVYGGNYPDGFDRSQAIAAGIEEREPGFERYFEALVDEMEEDYYSLPQDEQDRIYEQEMENFVTEREEARAERIAEDRAEWDGYEPW